ncbi:gastrula zinc finger protein XlCGF26.1 [Aedes aegypti]|uniref:Uncharacterized protein n=1 Tax=Aedes aegypti TaxID=7159 RepID=A0A1S4F5B6_AEDAE|nr:gastrula zinc finger protein XlCGF26.1 [Aedes aegypti]
MFSIIDAAACRICFDTAVSVKSLADIVDGNSLADMLRHCVNLEINQNDGLPYHCCSKCKEDLIVAYRLVTRCHESDTKFREMLETKFKQRSPTDNDLKPPLTEDDIKIEHDIDEEQIYAEPLLPNFDLDTNSCVKEEDKDHLRKKVKDKSDSSDDEIEDDDDGKGDDGSNYEMQSDENDSDDDLPLIRKNNTSERCCRCRIKLSTKEAVIEHLQAIHLIKRCTDSDKIKAKPFECDLCFKRYSTKRALRKHKLVLLVKNKFQCDQCELSFRLEKTLQRHKEGHRNIVQPYSQRKDQLPRCCACFEQFDTDELLKKHADESHPPDEAAAEDPNKPFPCGLCNRRYKNMRILKEHQSKPYRTVQYQCATCGRTFKEKCALADHERSHGEERSFICPVCSKPFAMRDSFRKHVKAHSLAEDRFKCEFCGKGFKAKANLKCHLITHNPQHRPIQCTLCPATFARKVCLQAHMKLHTGEKAHKCDQCGATYTFATDLRRHIMAHNGIKPHVCTICGRGYPRKDYLRKHMANHDQKRPDGNNLA